MNCLRSLDRWVSGFDPHSRYNVCVSLFCVCVILCVGNGLYMCCSYSEIVNITVLKSVARIRLVGSEKT
jgi:hypothetical protein